MSTPRRSRVPTLLGAVLRSAKELEVPRDVEVAPIAYRDWEAAVGSRIAARARPVKLDRGVLLVVAASATWSQELSLLSADIVARLRARGVEVEALRFCVGKVDPRERPPVREEVRTAPSEVPLPPPLRAELAKIDDDGLREAIALAASRQLAWSTTASRPDETMPRRARIEPVSETAAVAPSAARDVRSVAAERERSGHGSRPGAAARPGKR